MSMSRVKYRIRLVEKSEKEIRTKITAALDDARPFDTNSNARMRVEGCGYRVSKKYIDKPKERKYEEREKKRARPQQFKNIKFCFAD